MGLWHERALGHTAFVHHKEKTPFVKHLACKQNATVALLKNRYPSGKLYALPHLLIAVDGRVENLSTLAALLACPVSVDKVISTLYQKEGPDALFQLKGAVSVVLYDALTQTSLLYRAFFKGYPLFFVAKNNRLSVSSNPVALLHRDDIADTLDDSKLADIVTFNFARQKLSVFSEISEIDQGELVLVSQSGIERKKKPLHTMFAFPSIKAKEHTAETYTTMLQHCIQKTLEPDQKYGIMLSSGMDSSSVAVLASKMLKTNGQKLKAYSWTLPDDKSGDESAKIQELCKMHDIPLTLFNGEKFGPFDDLDNLYVNPITPYTNPFHVINQEAYRLASEEGITKLFNGGFADLLFPQRGSALYDALKDKKFDIFSQILKDAFKKHGWSALKRSPEIRNMISGFLLKRKKDTHQTYDWLSEEMKVAQGLQKHYFIHKEFSAFKYALSPLFAGYQGIDRYGTGRYGLEIIEAHRDLELLHYALGFPSYMSHRDRMGKYFAREGMKGLLPENIRTQPRAGNLIPFVNRSFQRNHTRIREMILDTKSSWNSYISEAWMENKLLKNADVTPAQMKMIWFSLNLDQWHRSIKPGGALYEFRG